MVDIHPKDSALELKLELRTVQRWYKAWKEGKNTPYSNLFVVHGLLAPEGKLADDTKSFVTE
jgi:hypothetical protein